jgi:hypothetical protein
MLIDNFKQNKLSFWPNVKISLDFELQNSKQIHYECCLNFKGIQTFWQKSQNFLKILSSHDLQEYEFRLAHLYSRIWSSFTSGKYDLV